MRLGGEKEKLSLGRALGCRRGWHGDRPPFLEESLVTLISEQERGPHSVRGQG